MFKLWKGMVLALALTACAAAPVAVEVKKCDVHKNIDVVCQYFVTDRILKMECRDADGLKFDVIVGRSLT